MKNISIDNGMTFVEPAEAIEQCDWDVIVMMMDDDTRENVRNTYDLFPALPVRAVFYALFSTASESTKRYSRDKLSKKWSLIFSASEIVNWDRPLILFLTVFSEHPKRRLTS